MDSAVCIKHVRRICECASDWLASPQLFDSASFTFLDIVGSLLQFTLACAIIESTLLLVRRYNRVARSKEPRRDTDMTIRSSDALEGIYEDVVATSLGLLGCLLSGVAYEKRRRENAPAA